jgi:hypothetical protein
VAIKIAAKVDATDREYFEDVLAPLLSDPLVEYVGEKGEFLERAYALLFPIDWPEPFNVRSPRSGSNLCSGLSRSALWPPGSRQLTLLTRLAWMLLSPIYWTWDGSTEAVVG